MSGEALWKTKTSNLHKVIHIHIHTYIYIYIYIHIYIYMYASMCIYIYMYVHMFLHMAIRYRSQDHYFYERGNAAVEVEMPLGKRMYPILKR